MRTPTAKGLALHEQSRIAHHLERVARGNDRRRARHASPGCAPQRRCARHAKRPPSRGTGSLAFGAARTQHCGIAAAFATGQLHVRQLREEADLSPASMIILRRLRTTPTSSSVPMWGLASTKDIGGRARLHERLEHVTDMGAFRARVQLPVRERARTAFAELDVRAHVKRSARVERRHGGNALVDRGTARSTTIGRMPARARYSAANKPAGPLQRPQDAARRKRRRPRTHRARQATRAARDPSRSRRARGAARTRRSALDRARHDEMDVALLPRIDAALERDDAPDRTQLHAEGARDPTTQHVAVLRAAPRPTTRERSKPRSSRTAVLNLAVRIGPAIVREADHAGQQLRRAPPCKQNRSPTPSAGCSHRRARRRRPARPSRTNPQLTRLHGARIERGHANAPRDAPGTGVRRLCPPREARSPSADRPERPHGRARSACARRDPRFPTARAPPAVTPFHAAYRRMSGGIVCVRTQQLAPSVEKRFHVDRANPRDEIDHERITRLSEPR